MRLSRWRRSLYSAVAAIIVPTVFFLVLEGGLRTYGYGYTTEFLVRNGDFYDSNPRFGWRFFPRTISRAPMPQHLPVKKPPGLYRVFVLGESAARGEPESAYGFARMLEAMLEKEFVGARFEIVNTATAAINSHVVLEIARDCAEKANPDLFIVLMGNNEVIGPFGPTHTFGSFSSSRTMIRLGLWTRSTRSGQLVHDVVNALRGTREPTQWRGMEAFLAQRVPRDDPRMAAVYDHFEQNLRDIVGIATEAGAKVILSTVPVNLKDSAPFASMHGPDLNEGQLTEWETYYQRGIDSQAAGEYDNAVRQYQSAAEIDGKYADLHFRLGSCYLALNRVDDAREHYFLARELDALRFRADTGINEAVRQVAAEWMDPHSDATVGSPSPALPRRRGVFLVDAERAFTKSKHTLAGLPGDELFWEHVHMNFQGNHELAALVLAGMIELLPDSIRRLGPDQPVAASLEDSATRLALTDWDRERVLGRVQEIISVPPFTDQLNHEEALKRVVDRRRELMKSMSPDALDETAEIYERAIAAAPDDAWLHRSMASFYMNRKKYAAAAEHLRAVLKSLPHDMPAHIDLARTYLHRGMASDAEQSLERALVSGQHAPISYTSIIRACTDLEHLSAAEAYGLRALSAYPDNALLLTMVAETYFKQGRHREASELLWDAIEKDPGFSTARWRLGTLLVMQGRRRDGLEQLERAVELEPFSPRPYSELAGVYTLTGESLLARQYMDKAEQIDPLDRGLIRQHAQWLELAGDLPQAVRRYRRVRELSPASSDAALELAWLLATSTDESLRNPPEALRLAQDAASRNSEPRAFVVLAAAYAANGAFDQAVESVDRALAEARQLGNPGMVNDLIRQKKRYGSKLPWSVAPEGQRATQQNF